MRKCLEEEVLENKNIELDITIETFRQLLEERVMDLKAIQNEVCDFNNLLLNLREYPIENQSYNIWSSVKKENLTEYGKSVIGLLGQREIKKRYNKMIEDKNANPEQVETLKNHLGKPSVTYGLKYIERGLSNIEKLTSPNSEVKKEGAHTIYKLLTEIHKVL